MTNITPEDVVIEREQYQDLLYTLFPSDVDNDKTYMMDVGSTESVSQINAFNTAYNNNDWATCKEILDNGLDVFSFTADKFNWLSDSIIALQRFEMNNIKSEAETVLDFLHQAVNTKLGMNFNLDYRVSRRFIKEWQNILKE